MKNTDDIPQRGFQEWSNTGCEADEKELGRGSWELNVVSFKQQFKRHLQSISERFNIRSVCIF